ncbi:LysR family transcriptional regulator [Rhodoferax aquaticus]|uniref:LysR family transcriptional regulator n=1 Tax=Rhodoferax aquaticus TaxID=2527691 RepID=A0A515ET81_9BURK|nr:LysR family transcriptional regulator [Rhodoferax aquaticus]QDL55886.1 LysR family transcriptional regulator [Rhodoferax aquaticus]
MKYPDFQIDWLRAFVAVVDAGSLSAAAPMLHRSQSAVSMQIKKLENALGKPVLVRGPRHMEITAAGTELLSYARRMLELQAQTHAALFGIQLEGRIRLGVPDDYATTYLAPVLRSFASRHHGVEIELTCEQSTSLIPKVGRGDLDLALVSRDKPQRGKLLFQEPLVWVGAPQFEVWRKTPLPIAVYESGSMARTETIAALAAKRRAYRVVYHSASLTGQVAAVESGLAVAVLTRCSVPASLQPLHNLPKEFELPALGTMNVALLRSKASQRSRAVDAMYEQFVHTLGT